MSAQKIQQLAQTTRTYRRLHSFFSLPLAIFLLIMGGTGLLLGWKKQAELLPPTQSGITPDARQWISLEQLQQNAFSLAQDSLQLSRTEIDRIDIRPEKGIAKVRFTEGYAELQFDLQSGQLLSAGRRHSDFIEQLHDGSILERWPGLNGDWSKGIYSTLTGLGLMGLSFSGFWLWYNPRKIRKHKQHRTFRV
jgi:uncharacterized iron-regulated membrane protein